MSNNEIISTDNDQPRSFDDIKQVDSDGNEFWSARDLMPLMGYSVWRNFMVPLERAMQAAKNQGMDVKNNFAGSRKVSGTRGPSQEDYILSRFAAYLVAMNGDPNMPEVATAQTYFAIQTYRQEQFDQLSDEQKRLYIRGQVTDENKKLFEIANDWGVESRLDFAIFNNEGYKGLYGLTAKQIAEKKSIGKDNILDRAGSTELAANLFRITQTKDKLNTTQATNKQAAGKVHNMVGGKVRDTIKAIGGIVPEDLPPEEENIRQLEKRVGKFGELKSSNKAIENNLKEE